MADYRAIAAVAEALIQLLRTSYRPSSGIDDLLGPSQELEFEVYSPKDFEKPMANGLSLFLYRVFPSGVIRTPAGRLKPDGSRLRTELPLELHFLLTVWAGRPSLQHALAGWAMRTLEDTALLPAAVLNSAAPGGFRDTETVSLGLAELRTEDLLRIWDVLGTPTYQLSIPYYVRIVSLESVQEQADSGAPVQIRELELGILERPQALL